MRSGFVPAAASLLASPRAAGAAPLRHVAAGRGALAPLELPDLALGPEQRARRPDPAEEAAQAAAARLAALEAARAEGRAEGEAAGRAAAAAEHAAARETAEAAALAAAAAALRRIEADAAAAVGEAATALARLLLAALDAALPAAAARLAPDSAVLLARAMRPALERAGRLTLHVAPGLGAAVAARLGEPRVTVLEDAALAPGDARAEWGDGAAEAVLAERRQALAAVLATLGLGPDAPGADQPNG